MIVVGLTGQSGAGKGYICGIWQKMGIPSLDTDAVAHELYNPGQPCLAEIVDAFGKEILRPDGTLDRKRLGEIVFSDPDALQRLNRISHAYIRTETVAWTERMRQNGVPMVVIDAPVLFESGFDAMCDCTVGVLADRETRIARILARDGISREKAQARIDVQKSDAFFTEHCDYIIRNEWHTDPKEQVIRVTERIRREHGA